MSATALSLAVYQALRRTSNRALSSGVQVEERYTVGEQTGGGGWSNQTEFPVQFFRLGLDYVITSAQLSTIAVDPMLNRPTASDQQAEAQEHALQYKKSLRKEGEVCGLRPLHHLGRNCKIVAYIPLVFSRRQKQVFLGKTFATSCSVFSLLL